MGVFSRVVTWLFARFHDVTMAALTGIMLGALLQPGREVATAAARHDGSAATYWLTVAGVGAVAARTRPARIAHPTATTARKRTMTSARITRVSGRCL